MTARDGGITDSSGDPQFRIERAVNTLRRRGMRLTRLKRDVLHAFAAGDCALTAEEIAARVGLVTDLSPLYRCLASLEEAGILTHFYLGDGWRRYDPADEFGSHHHHLVCEECAGVSRIDGCLLAGGATAEATARGYRVHDHEVVLKGVCPQCVREGAGFA